MLVLIFILFLFFICRFSSFTFSFRHHPSPFRGLSPGFYIHFVLSASPSHSDSRHFHFLPFRYFLTASATVLSGHFLLTGGFYLMLLPDIFGTTCFYQGFSGSRQLFLEICRPRPSVCLIHSNPQPFIHLKFVFIYVSIAKVFICGENFDKKYRSETTLFSKHKNIKQQSN